MEGNNYDIKLPWRSTGSKKCHSSVVKDSCGKIIRRSNSQTQFKLPPIPPLDKFEQDPWQCHPLLLQTPIQMARNVQTGLDRKTIQQNSAKNKTETWANIIKQRCGPNSISSKGDQGQGDINLTQDDFVEFLR